MPATQKPQSPRETLLYVSHENMAISNPSHSSVCTTTDLVCHQCQEERLLWVFIQQIFQYQLCAWFSDQCWEESIWKMLKREWVKEALMFSGNLKKSSGKILFINIFCVPCALNGLKPNLALHESYCSCFTNREIGSGKSDPSLSDRHESFCHTIWSRCYLSLNCSLMV